MAAFLHPRARVLCTPSLSRNGIRLCSGGGTTTNNSRIVGAIGSRGTRGSGKSLIGSVKRGVRAEELGALQSGEYSLDGAYHTDDQLEGSDVLMEVLAEDNRFARTVEFSDAEMLARAHEQAKEDAKEDEEPKLLPAPKGPLAHQRKYLSHRGVTGSTVYARDREAGVRRAEMAVEATFTYQLPAEAKAAREAHKRSRARQREHDIIENRIQEAMASGEGCR